VPTFWLLLNRCLHSIKALCPTLSLPKVSKLEVGKRLGEDMAGTSDKTDQKDFSKPYGVMLSNKN